MRVNRKIASVISLFVITVVLFLSVPLSGVYARYDNPQGATIDFPASGDDDTFMDKNLGSIGTLFHNGSLNENIGSITNSYGTVLINSGAIDSLGSGHVGTNKGTIESINNTGSLGVNDSSGKVKTNGVGNVITRNDGNVESNNGTVSENFGEIGVNNGTVYMRDGIIDTNAATGKVYYDAKIVGEETVAAKGAVNNNAGNITINNGRATVASNTGVISLGENAELICTNNSGTIIKLSPDVSVTVTNGAGAIGPLYEIKFVGDDGQATVEDCDYVEAGVCYCQSGGGVFFSLPEGYACVDADAMLYPENPSWLYINVYIAEGSTEFVITCHKCSSEEYKQDESGHWQICNTDCCGKRINEAVHVYGDFVSDNNATCITDGTKTRKCTICGYKETVTDVDSHLTSDKHNPVIDKAKAPTKTETGLTEGVHCADCNRILVAQKIVPVLESPSEDGKQQKSTDVSGGQETADSEISETETAGNEVSSNEHSGTEKTDNVTVEKKETEKQETEKQEAEKQETEKQETEKQEAEKQENEKQENENHGIVNQETGGEQEIGLEEDVTYTSEKKNEKDAVIPIAVGAVALVGAAGTAFGLGLHKRKGRNK